MRYHEIITEAARASLWHGLALDRALRFLSLGYIEGRSWQRYWPDGRRRTEHEPDYKSSFYMKGISTTRDRRYAENWGDVVFELDGNALRLNHKIIPYSWGFHMNRPGEYQNDHKREREEFIVTAFVEKTDDDYRREYDQKLNALRDKAEKTGDWTEYENWKMQVSNFAQYMSQPDGIPIDLNRCLKAVYINVHKVRHGENRPEVQAILNHPRFGGAYYTPLYRETAEEKADALETVHRITTQYRKL